MTDTSLREKALRATKGNWRRHTLGGYSTVVSDSAPARNDTRIPGYGYRDEQHCLAYPFIKDDDGVRYDFVCFSHGDADWIAATQPKAILALLDASEATRLRIEALEAENAQLESDNARLRGAISEAAQCLDGEPDYHPQGMGCGLEDRGITDRYDAMEHGWEKAMERVYGENIAWAKDALSSALSGKEGQS